MFRSRKKSRSVIINVRRLNLSTKLIIKADDIKDGWSWTMSLLEQGLES